MSEIDIRRKHSLTPAKAREAAEKVARQLKREFALEYRWEGSSLHFERQGVDGRLTVNTGEVHLRAKLGLLLAFLKPQIERKVHEHLDEALEPARVLARKPSAQKPERKKGGKA
jgi:putative polyhydroxyalkanoate system protein